MGIGPAPIMIKSPFTPESRPSRFPSRSGYQNMCGIFGLVIKPQANSSTAGVRPLVDLLFRLSESRGKEAAGLAIRTGESVTVYKRALSATSMIAQVEYAELFNGAQPSAVIGHARLVTNGRQTLPNNNQPVIKSGLVGIHNGIITNDAALWKKFPGLKREYEVDTESLLALIAMFHAQTGEYPGAVRKAFEEIEGMASIAFFPEDRGQLILATNNGSLYIAHSPGAGAMSFASEEYILRRFMENPAANALLDGAKPAHLAAGAGVVVDLADISMAPFTLAGAQPIAGSGSAPAARIRIIDLSEKDDPTKAVLRRCTRCILPETMPFIEFGDNGVCNYCHRYQYPPRKGLAELEKMLAPYRRTDGRPDCVFAFSGGRDSCYGLHLVKKELGMNPVAYTYDWGMVTDLARRNQARLCGKLGVEHIIVSADIKRKREYVRMNVQAWLKKPELGMIPLFMAGDKQFFKYAYEVMEQTGARVIIFSTNERYEMGQFKEGFCGVDPGGARAIGLTSNRLGLAGYYMGQYLRNPAYINASLLDTMSAFYYSYMIKHDYILLFEHAMWEERQVVSTLINEYNWETSPDTTATWRIGDGTAPFYNYIYHTVAGFSEHDTFRSHQARDEAITREEALRLAAEENKPRWESMAWYANTIGFDLDEAIRVINAMPKLYNKKG